MGIVRRGREGVEGGSLARRSADPVTLKLNRASRDPGRGVPRRAVSPAWPTGQGCSPAVAPARPLRVPGVSSK